MRAEVGMTHPRRLTTACLVGLLAVAGAASAEAPPEDAGQAAAESWLKLVDAANYAASWSQAAEVFKGTVKQAEWPQMAEGVRSPLGSLVSRKLRSRKYTEKAPTSSVFGGRVYSWGPGKYVVLEYEAVFANRPTAVETLTSMADRDGAWRVAAYSVR
jgi:hypothetical protein